MKMIKPLMLMLISLAFCLTPLTPLLEQEAYGAERLEEEKPYDLLEVMCAVLEESKFRMNWLEQTTERFPFEPLFKKTLEAERERATVMRQLFTAWGYAKEPAEPPYDPQAVPGLEQAVRGMRDMAERGMMMSRRMEAVTGAAHEVRVYAHMWGHEYRQQLDECDMRAESLGYEWAWQYDIAEPDQEPKLP